MKKIIKVLLLGLIIFSCSTNPESESLINDYRTILINDDNHVVDQFSDLFETVEFIKLETKQEGLVGRIRRIIVIDEYIIIPGTSRYKQTIIFNSDGKHYSTINTIGKGPEEYLNPFSVIYDPITNGIMICDNQGRKYVWYTLEGNHIKSTTSEILGYAHGISENKYYIVYCGSYATQFESKVLKHSLIVTDTSLNLISMYWPHSAGYIELIGLEEIITSNNKTFFTPPYCDTIYSIKSNVINKEYVIKFENNQLEYQKALELDRISGDMQNKVIQTVIDKKLKIRAYNYFVTSNKTLIFSFLNGDKVWSCYNWEDNKTVILDRNELVDDFYNIFYYNPYTCYKNKLVMINEPYQIIKRAKELFDKVGEIEYNKFLERQPEVKSLLADLKESDNPILIYCKIKADFIN